MALASVRYEYSRRPEARGALMGGPDGRVAAESGGREGRRTNKPRRRANRFPRARRAALCQMERIPLAGSIVSRARCATGPAPSALTDKRALLITNARLLARSLEPRTIKQPESGRLGVAWRAHTGRRRRRRQANEDGLISARFARSPSQTGPRTDGPSARPASSQIPGLMSRSITCQRNKRAARQRLAGRRASESENCQRRPQDNAWK